MKIKNLCGQFFESCEVSGDKITIHKCVIDKAIKNIKKDKDYFYNEYRKAGHIDILTDMLEIMYRAKIIEIDKENGRH